MGPKQLSMMASDIDFQSSCYDVCRLKVRSIRDRKSSLEQVSEAAAKLRETRRNSFGEGLQSRARKSWSGAIVTCLRGCYGKQQRLPLSHLLTLIVIATASSFVQAAKGCYGVVMDTSSVLRCDLKQMP